MFLSDFNKCDMASLKRPKRSNSAAEHPHTFRVAVFGQTGVGKTGKTYKIIS